MSRMVLAEQAHAIPIIYPQGSAAPTIDSDVFSMKNASHVTIFLFVGAQAGSFTAILYECDDFTPSAAVAVEAAVYKEETTNSDTLGDRTALATTGFNTAATNNIWYVIEIDAEDLDEGYPNLQLKLSALDNTTYVSAFAVLTGYAYQGKDQSSEIA